MFGYVYNARTIGGMKSFKKPAGEANVRKTSRFGFHLAADSMAHACLSENKWHHLMKFNISQTFELEYLAFSWTMPRGRHVVSWKNTLLPSDGFVSASSTSSNSSIPSCSLFVLGQKQLFASFIRRRSSKLYAFWDAGGIHTDSSLLHVLSTQMAMPNKMIVRKHTLNTGNVKRIRIKRRIGRYVFTLINMFTNTLVWKWSLPKWIHLRTEGEDLYSCSAFAIPIRTEFLSNYHAWCSHITRDNIEWTIWYTYTATSVICMEKASLFGWQHGLIALNEWVLFCHALFFSVLCQNTWS